MFFIGDLKISINLYKIEKYNTWKVCKEALDTFLFPRETSFGTFALEGSVRKVSLLSIFHLFNILVI